MRRDSPRRKSRPLSPHPVLETEQGLGLGLGLEQRLSEHRKIEARGRCRGALLLPKLVGALRRE